MSDAPPIPENALYEIELYPERVDFNNLSLVFCRMSRQSYRESPFLDHRIVHAPGEGFAMPFSDIDRLVDLPATPVTHAVFHSAFCCSTLLSRHIDALGRNLVLREPHALYELLILDLMQGTGTLPDVPPERITRLLTLVQYLLGRRHQHDQPVVIKYTDGCNIGMVNLLSGTPGNRGLFMWSGLERFLTSILKYPHRRQWVYIRLQEILVAWKKREGNLPLDQRPLQPHLAAALLWILQMENLERMFTTLPRDTLVTLDAQTFLANPVGILLQVMKHFDTQLERQEIEEKLSTTRLDTHAKTANETYDSAKREDDFNKARSQFAAEIDAAMDWAGDVLEKDWRDYTPPAPLSDSNTTD